MAPDGYIVIDKKTKGTEGSFGKEREHPALTKAGAEKYVAYRKQTYAGGRDAKREFEIKPLGDVPFVGDWNPPENTH